MQNKKTNRIIILAIKLTGVAIILLFASKPISAQWFAETGAGYMLPRNMGYNQDYSDLTVYYNTLNGETTRIIEEKIHLSALQSFTYNLGGGYVLKNFEFALGIMYASNLLKL